MLSFLLISLFVFAGFTVERVLAELFGPVYKPNLLIILVVFFNLFRGIRYSLTTAFLAGLLQDCFSAKLFGLNIFSFILCAYLTTYVKMYVYLPGSSVSRFLLFFIMSSLTVLIQYVLNVMFFNIDFAEAFVHLLIPEVLITCFTAILIFEDLKRCALKLFA